MNVSKVSKKRGFIQYYFSFKKSSAGFTLIELLIVIAIIAILAAVAFVALDPLTRFRDARDSSRWNDITAILSAIKVDQVDNGGSYLGAITSTTAGTEYMIGTDTSSCETFTCDVTISASGDCVDLTGLATEGYVSSVPISPTGAITWTAGHTGYYLIRNSVGSVTVGSCESENTSDIAVTR
jgi:prepilin-type N-terminal cleavage/methylation domain-containing protein